MKKLKLAVIGCGDITKFMMIFAAITYRVEVVGCADIDRKKAEKYTRYFTRARAFTDYDDMVSAVQPDAVYLAVPHYLHHPIMKKMIDYRVHVFCEKPITTNVADAEEIVVLAKSNRVKVAVNYQYRYDKACYQMVMAARSGALGRLHYAVCNLHWHRDPSYFSSAPWHATIAQSGGGTLLTQGSHFLDIALWAMGKTPTKVTALTRRLKFDQVEVEDTAAGIIELGDDQFISVLSSMSSAKEEPATISIYGEKGQLHFRDSLLNKLTVKNLNLKRYRLPVKGIHSLHRSLKGFVSWILDDVSHLSTAADAILVLRCVDEMYRSARHELSP